MKKDYWVIFILVFISGCTTIQDFQKMDAYQRADFVCKKDKTVKSYEDEISTSSGKIDAITNALDKGYRVHKACNTIEEEIPDTTTCENYKKNKKEIQECSHTTKKSYKEICNDIVIPIIVELDKENLSKYKSLLNHAVIEKNKAYQQCFNKIIIMNAQKAYEYYSEQVK